MGDFVIKFVDGQRIGFLRTETAKYYLGIDGVLSIVPIGRTDSSFCGNFDDGALTNIPSEFVQRVSPVLEKLTYMHFVLTGKANYQINGKEKRS